jgi:ribosomal protein L27
MFISADTSPVTGGTVVLYADNHASKASDWELRSANVPKLSFDTSAAKLVTAVGINVVGAVAVQAGGSAAAPALAVTTGALGVAGMTVLTANTLSFITSATEQMRLTASGLGIGTTAPDGKLHVMTASAGTAIGTYKDLTVESNTNMGFQFLSPNNTAQFISFGDPDDIDVGQIFYSHVTNAMAFKTTGAEAMRIDTSGNVVIGNTALTGSTKLEVYGNVAAHVGIRANNAHASGYATLWLSNAGSNDGLIRGGASSSFGPNELALLTGSAIPLTFYTNNIKRMTIAAAGTVNVVGDITANNFAGRNRIINGDFAIWQRGTSFSPGANAQVYTADRFFMNRNGVSEWTVSRQGYSEQYSCRVQRNVSTTSTQPMRVRQVLESANCGGIVGETVTFSCEIKVGANFSGASSNIFLTIAQGSGNDETGGKMATGFTGVVTTSSTIVGTTSFVKYSVTSGVIGATISQLGVLIEATPVGTAGANDWYEVRNVQLEVGATATEFEVRSVGNTLDLCQRYYNNASSITVNGNTAGMSANVTSGINYHAVVTFPVAMRVPPTLVWSEWSSSRFPTTAAVFQVAGNLGVNAYKGANSTGAGYFLGGYTATAEL